SFSRACARLGELDQGAGGRALVPLAIVARGRDSVRCGGGGELGQASQALSERLFGRGEPESEGAVSEHIEQERLFLRRVVEAANQFLHNGETLDQDKENLKRLRRALDKLAEFDKVKTP